MTGLYVETMYGANTRKGLCNVTLTDEEGKSTQITVSPEDARAMAMNLLEAAEAATQEEMLVRFLTEETKVPLQQAAQVIGVFRKYRDSNSG